MKIPRQVARAALCLTLAVLPKACAGKQTASSDTPAQHKTTATASPGSRKVNAKVQCVNSRDTSKPISPSDAATDVSGKLDLIEKFSGIADFATSMPDDVKRYTITFSCGSATYKQSDVSVYVHPTFTCKVIGSKCS